MQEIRREALVTWILPRYWKVKNDYRCGALWMMDELMRLERRIRWICKRSGMNASFFLGKA